MDKKAEIACALAKMGLLKDTGRRSPTGAVVWRTTNLGRDYLALPEDSKREWFLRYLAQRAGVDFETVWQ